MHEDITAEISFDMPAALTKENSDEAERQSITMQTEVTSPAAADSSDTLQYVPRRSRQWGSHSLL